MAEHPRAVCIYFNWLFARSRAAMNAVVIAKAIAMRGPPVTSGHRATQCKPNQSSQQEEAKAPHRQPCHPAISFFMAAPFRLSARAD
jgi:hypothetical protein